MESYIRYNSENASVAVYNQKNDIPNYSLSKNPHPLCLASKRDKYLGSGCRKFYAEINEGAGEQVCPLGFTVSYLKIGSSLY